MSSSPSRAAQFAKIYKVLKKSYKPVAPTADRQVLEHLVFACCLENAHFEKAEEAFATLVHTFFDWNEIRVTTVKELAEILAVLPDPAAAATRLKRVLQHVFESTYSFDLEDMRKKNLGQSVERLQKFTGITDFVVSYAVQNALGGHSIPLDSGTLGVLRLLDLITDKDVKEGAVPGLERAIAKNKGVEFASLLHQLGADFVANPYVPAFHKILLQISPDLGPNLPKRRPKPKPEAEPATAAGEAKPSSAEAPGKRAKKAKKGSDEAVAAPHVEPPPAPKPASVSAPEPESKPGAGKKKPAPPAKSLPQGRPSQSGRSSGTEVPSGAAGSKKEPAGRAEPSVGKKSVAAGLSKRKPR